MLRIFNTNLETGVTSKIKELEKGSWINMIAPTEEEIKSVCNQLNMKEDFIRY